MAGATGAGAPLHGAILGILAAAVHRSFYRLPEVEVGAITLRNFKSPSCEGIVNMRQCPVGTAQFRIFRAHTAIDRDMDIDTDFYIDIEKGVATFRASPSQWPYQNEEQL